MNAHGSFQRVDTGMWSGGWYETSIFFQRIDIIGGGNKIKCLRHLKKKVAIGMTLQLPR